MCLGVPGEIVSMEEGCGVVSVGGVKRKVYMQLVPEAQIGDYVLIHAGCAIQILDQEEAYKAIEFLKELAENEAY